MLGPYIFVHLMDGYTLIMFLFPDWVFPGRHILRHPGLVGTCPDCCWMVTGEGHTPAVHQSLPQGDETMWGCHWYTACLYCPYQHLQFALLQVVISDLVVILFLWRWPLEAPPVSNFSWKVVNFVYSLLCMVTSNVVTIATNYLITLSACSFCYCQWVRLLGQPLPLRSFPATTHNTRQTKRRKKR